MEPSIKGCALRFLDQWFLEEEKLYDGLKPGNTDEEKLKTLKGAMRYFSIARNFPTKHDKGRSPNRFRLVISALGEVDVQKESILEVADLQGRLSEDYGGRRFYSAASKLLWLLKRDDVIIYDSQVRKSLGFPREDYSEYCEIWEGEFSKLESDIRSACNELETNYGWAVCSGGVPDSEVRQTVAEPWFHRRVFDTYHWFRAGM